MKHTAPEGYTSVAPWVVTDDTGALLDFITAAFDGEEVARVPSKTAPSATARSASVTRSYWPSTAGPTGR